MSAAPHFQSFGLSENTLIAIDKKGFEVPSPIQQKIIPMLMKGQQDIIGQAQTGTGKTAAFGLPLMEKIDPASKTVKALILTPTRELTLQVAEELTSLRGQKKIKILPVYGGQSIEMQLRHLKTGVQIVVGTPGRILDHLKRKSLNLQNLDFCILDEADEMLNMGFMEDVGAILSRTNENKRMLLFSATMPREILDVAKKHMKSYEFIQVSNQAMTVPQTDQIYFQVREADKFEALCRIIDIEETFYGLVFCRTKVDVDRIAGHLIDRGYDAEALHGDLSQAQRENVMARFRKNQINILVATDVAARGLDVQDLTHVINFSLPQDTDAYIHRIGRTGRAGKEGTAVTFITPTEERKLLFIEKKTKTRIRKERIPEIHEIIDAKKQRIQTDLQSLIAEGAHADHLQLARDLLKQEDAEVMLAALLGYAFDDELDPSNYHAIRGWDSEMPGQTRLFIAKGRKDGMTPKKLIRFINDHVPVPPKKMNDILIQESFSFINVPFRDAEKILSHFQKRKKGKKALVEKAVPKT